MSDFLYTNYKDTYDSSAVSDVYYNSDNQQLVVVTHTGAMAGYENVPLSVFLAMATHYDARDEGGSVGRYWNTEVKPKYTGFSTSDIEDFVDVNAENPNAPVDDDPEYDGSDYYASPFTPDEVNKINNILNAGRFTASVGGATWNVPAPVIDLPQNEYVVGFEFAKNGDEFDAELTVFASSPDSALASFGSAVDLLGYESVKVKFVTRYFN
jgi:hypothetical protein